MSSPTLDPLLATNVPELSNEAHFRRPRPSPRSGTFSRLDTTDSGTNSSRSRASTLQNLQNRDVSISPDASNLQEPQGTVASGDLFPQSPIAMEEGYDTPEDPQLKLSQSLSASRSSTMGPAEELPIELASLTDRFIDSLSAKVHPTPPAVEKLSELFQDFYHLAETHISTHISTLSSRQQRQFSNGTAALPRRKGERPASARANSEQQMLTQTELDQRRKIRKGLERKRVALEEAVERRACEGVYERIWRHRSTQDEEQDEKLRSKTAALGVVGIGLAELGIQIGTEPLEAGSGVTTEEDVRRWLGDARDELIKMNDERFPLGKLLHLKAAHKAIVDTLSRMHQSSSSADEILPTMIYTLITTPMKGINVISNLYFIQRFRADSKIDGEAAYCLTNLEAAITFLETVDLASLRADEAPAGSSKSDSRPPTPSLENAGLFPQAPLLSSSVHSSSPPTSAPVTATSLSTTSGALLNPSTLSRPSTPSSHLRQRRLSHLLHQPSHALNTASDAVLHGADQSLKTITTTLESSYRLLFGRLRERQLSGGGLDNDGHIVVPTTLDEARKLVSTPGPGNAFEDDGTGSGASSIHHASEESKKDLIPAGSIGTGTLLSLIGGRSSTTARERSYDSAKSTTGSKRLAFTDGPAETESPSAPSSAARAPKPATASNPPTPPTVQATQSMRSLTNKFDLNPLNRLASLGGGGMAAMRNFGRSPSSQPSVPTTLAPTSAASAMTNTAPPSPGVSAIDTAVSYAANRVTTRETTTQIAPPIERFVEMENPGDMRISEVLELLRDYRRLAGALSVRGAFL